MLFKFCSRLQGTHQDDVEIVDINKMTVERIEIKEDHEDLSGGQIKESEFTLWSFSLLNAQSRNLGLDMTVLQTETHSILNGVFSTSDYLSEDFLDSDSLTKAIEQVNFDIIGLEKIAAVDATNGYDACVPVGSLFYQEKYHVIIFIPIN